jgi:hypothetical protein
VDKHECRRCGATTNLRIIQQMNGWGQGFMGFHGSEVWCLKCCCKWIRGHYRIVRELRAVDDPSRRELG